MFRDFSNSSKQELLSLVSKVENEKLSNFTDWIGDRWYDFEYWIGALNVRNYINNVNIYHKKVIDKNNATKKSIEKIFKDVHNVDDTYHSIFTNINCVFDKWDKYISTMNTIISPTNGKFNAREMDVSLKSILLDIKSLNGQCLRDQMVQDIDGVLVFDEELIYEYIKKDPAEMTDEEQKVLIDVIAKLQDTVAGYESLATFGTDELGADILNKAFWVDSEKEYNSLSVISAHYNNIYINILDFISEQSKDSNTFASTLVKISNGEFDFSVIGAEYIRKVGKIFGDTSFVAYVAKYKTKNREGYFGKFEASEKLKGKSSYKFKGTNKKAKDYLKDKGQYYDAKDTFYLDESGKIINKEDAPKFYDREMTIAEINKKYSASVSLYDGTHKNKLGGGGKVNVVVGRAEAHASLSGGFYVVGNDGERKFSPGVKAEVGTSVTALEGEWEQQWLGNEMLGLNTDVTATVGKAEAKADVGFQVYDEDGKLAIEVGASASAEAIAAEIEGSVGANVLGGEIGVKGGVNVGIGAHADVGYKDGVFKCDIGASLGVGVSLGLEVDVGGMVDTVTDKASSAWNSLKSGWKSIWN